MTMMVSGQGASGGDMLTNMQQRILELLSARWFPWVVNIGALLLLVWGLASWTWVLFKPNTPQVIANSPNNVPVATISFNPQTLLAAHLFGQAPVSQVGQSLENIPLSSLNLVLTGVVAAGGASYALISVDGQPQEPFAVGQEIISGATLQAVYPDRAILSRSGVSESLMLEGMAKSLPDVIGVAPPPQADVQQMAPNQFALPRTMLTEQLRRPKELFSQALVVPNTGGGFLVREIQPNSLYEKLGLRVGDVIHAVNGKPVNTVDDAMKAYQAASTQRDIRIGIIREGQPDHLIYNLQ